MRLADLGARVLKIENPAGGDVYRNMYISDKMIDGDHLAYHSVNRSKESLALDMKDENSRETLHKLLKKADVMILNYRPGVAKRLGIDYESVKKINPNIVYGDITGYGKEGPWVKRPGQDLLVQSVAGFPYLNGNADQPPLPLGLGIADLMSGEHLIQGVLAGLASGKGAYVEVSLLESSLDVQFEVLTAYLNDGHQLPKRSSINNANPYIAAPYGIYSTADGYIALAMCPIPRLAELLSCKALEVYTDSEEWSTKRDEIKAILRDHLYTQTTGYWLSILEAADIWCADVMNWKELMETEGFKVLDMVQTVVTSNDYKLDTLRCPIHIDGEIYKSDKGCPKLNEHDEEWLASILQ